jgi:cellulose synthase/poly-beta-1,6-N-acetylglucosamine synthase-like glycosyltransferase
MSETFIYYYWVLGLFFLVYFGLVNLVYAIVLSLGSYNTAKRIQQQNKEDTTSILRSNSLPELTFLVPVYNEPTQVVKCVETLLSLTYRYKEVIIINDGSDDETLDLLKKTFSLEPMPIHYQQVLPSKPVRNFYKSTTHSNLIVIDKENGTKFDALNAGLNACNTPYFITIDADTIIDNNEFESVIRPILMTPETIAVGAGVRISNDCFLKNRSISTEKFPKSYFPSMQTLEYLRSFLMRQGWNYTGGNYCIAGAFAVFSREAVMNIKGYAPTFANDLEIVMRLHRFYQETEIPYKITYLPEPVAWTEGPNTYKRLAFQRMLWHRGLLESLWFHKKMFFNPQYGAFGTFVYPVAVFGEAFEPLVEILGYTYVFVGLFLGIISWPYIGVLLLVSWGLTMVFSLFCLMIEELGYRKYPTFQGTLKLIGYGLLENFGYRQLTLLWRANGFRGFFKRYKIIKNDSKKIQENIKLSVQEHQDEVDSHG